MAKKKFRRMVHPTLEYHKAIILNPAEQDPVKRFISGLSEVQKFILLIAVSILLLRIYLAVLPSDVAKQLVDNLGNFFGTK